MLRWAESGADLQLDTGELAVFLVPVTPGSPWAAQLSDADRVELRRWRQQADQERFIAARGALRTILARLSGARQPGELNLVRTPRGRLFLDPRAGRSDLDFNLSHAGGFVLIAVCSRGRVGVDIEDAGRALDIAGVSRLVLTAEEQDRLAATRGEAERRALFFTCWVRKEAVTKADGRGLACGMDRFPVLDNSAVSRLVTLADEAGIPRNWRVLDIAVPAGYHGALATDLQTGAPRLFLASPAAFGLAIG